VRRGEVYLVNPQPAKGVELAKIRPALIVSSDAINEQPSLPVLVILGSGAEHYSVESPALVRVEAKSGHLKKDTVFSALHLKSFDRSRFEDPKTGELKYLCTLGEGHMRKVDMAMLFALELHPYLPLAD
jgi:mRNA interferase MazF